MPGYNRAERLADYKTGQEFVFMLVDIVSRGGNLLLNVGPSGLARSSGRCVIAFNTMRAQATARFRSSWNSALLK
jgi:hypothetical protein